jgi:hypothetical protein
MTPGAHVGLTVPLAALIAWKAEASAAAWFSAGSILIDIDHLIFFARRTGRYSPMAMSSWYKAMDQKCTPDSYYGLHIFHTVEPLLLGAIAAAFWPTVWWIMFGMAFHLALDLISLYCHPVLRVTVRPLSWVEHVLRRRRGEREFWRSLP